MARFDLVDTEFAIASDVQKIKAVNPNCKIIGYLDSQYINPESLFYPEVTLHENWFLHDINGNRIVNKTYGAELLDPANSEWQNYYANTVLNYCNTYGFDGVFTDDIAPITEWHRNNAFTVPGSDIPPEIVTQSHDKLLNFVRNVKAKLAGKLMILNLTYPCLDIANYADGYNIEDFLNPTWIAEHIPMLFAYPQKTKVCFSVTVDPDFSFASALLADNVYWGYAKSTWYPSDPNTGYPPQMDIDTGRPIGAYTVENGIYKRTFEHVKATVDLNTETATLTFEETPLPPSGCFIATACYGSPTNHRVCQLRKLKDAYVARSRTASLLYRLYYVFSPSIANFIRERENLKKPVRKVIEWLAQKM